MENFSVLELGWTSVLLALNYDTGGLDRTVPDLNFPLDADPWIFFCNYLLGSQSIARIRGGVTHQ